MIIVSSMHILHMVWFVSCWFFILTAQSFLSCTLEPISYGRTKDRYITQEEGHLSFPNAAIVTVLGKDAATDTSGQEMWLAEVHLHVRHQAYSKFHTVSCVLMFK